MTVKSYNHVAIQVGDLDKAEAFWVGGLGLRKLERPGFGVPGFWLAVGDAQLHLVELAGGTPTPGRLPHIGLSVDLPELRRMVEVLPAAGGTELSPLGSRGETGAEVWTAVYADPDGNVVELTTAPTG